MVFSSTMDRYWSLLPSCVLPFRITSAPVARAKRRMPLWRECSGDQLSALTPFSLLTRMPSGVR